MRYEVKGRLTEKWHLWKSFENYEEAVKEAKYQCVYRWMDFCVKDMLENMIVFEAIFDADGMCIRRGIHRKIDWRQHGF